MEGKIMEKIQSFGAVNPKKNEKVAEMPKTENKQKEVKDGNKKLALALGALGAAGTVMVVKKCCTNKCKNTAEQIVKDAAKEKAKIKDTKERKRVLSDMAKLCDELREELIRITGSADVDPEGLKVPQFNYHI